MITSIYTDQSSETVSTSTSTSCTTVTACTGTATTITTTSATATTVDYVCDITNCGASCRVSRKRKMTLPTSLPRPDDNPGSRELDVWLNQTANPVESPGPDTASIPSPGKDDWSGWYDNIYKDGYTVILNNREKRLGSNTAVHQERWSTLPRNVIVHELSGCVAVIGVSHVGQLSI